jgi:fluoride ion exporter CrcB/FEX
MITSVNDNWKIPIGYFYVNGLSALKRTALIKSCFEFLKDLGEKYPINQRIKITFSTGLCLGYSLFLGFCPASLGQMPT